MSKQFSMYFDAFNDCLVLVKITPNLGGWHKRKMCGEFQFISK